VNLSTLDQLTGDTFDMAKVMELGVIKKPLDGLKILANGEITRPIHVTANIFSKAAEEKIKAAGGTVTLIEKKQQ
jgi:large subunit ribosomal protein L15